MDDFSVMDDELDSIVLTLTKGVLALVGLFLNAGVIYITVRARWLHTPCNILLAAYEFCLLIYDLNKLLEVRRVFFDLKFSMIKCFYVSAFFLSSFVISFVLMAAIAIDRLISVIWPLNYAHLNRKVYFTFVILAALGSAAAMLLLAYDTVQTYPGRNDTSCGITSTLKKNAKYFMYYSLVCELLSVFIYALLWLLMRCSAMEHVASTKRIFKSLLCILLVSLFGFTPNTSYHMFASILGIPKFWRPDNNIFWARIASEATAYFALIGCCANVLILFFASWEYRRAFLRYLPWLRHLFPTSAGQYPQKPKPNNIQLPAQLARSVLPGPSGGLNSPSAHGQQVSPVETLQQQRQQFLFKRNSHPQYIGGAGSSNSNNVGGDASNMPRRSTVFHAK